MRASTTCAVDDVTANIHPTRTKAFPSTRFLLRVNLLQTLTCTVTMEFEGQITDFFTQHWINPRPSE